MSNDIPFESPYQYGHFGTNTGGLQWEMFALDFFPTLQVLLFGGVSHIFAYFSLEIQQTDSKKKWNIFKQSDIPSYECRKYVAYF